MQQNYKKEIKSLVSTEKIVEKVNFGSQEQIVGKDGRVHILYKTTCLVNQKSYVGIHSFDKTKKNNRYGDKYIGNGLNCNCRGRGNQGYGISHFKRAVDKYGYENFVREDLLFFETREALLEAEKLVVDQEFVNDQNNFNNCLGGGCPPRKVGKDNGNYGNRWSEEQRLKFRKYLEKNRDTKGGKNFRAVPVVLIDLVKEEVLLFDYIRGIGEATNVSKTSLSKYWNVKDHLFDGHFLIMSQSDWTGIFPKEKLKLLSIKQQYFRCWYQNLDDSHLLKLNGGTKWYKDLYRKEFEQKYLK